MPRVAKIEKSPDASDVSPPAFEDALAQLPALQHQLDAAVVAGPRLLLGQGGDATTAAIVMLA